MRTRGATVGDPDRAVRPEGYFSEDASQRAPGAATGIGTGQDRRPGRVVAVDTDSDVTITFDAIRQGLHPLDQPPLPPGWNHHRLVELIGNAPRRRAAVLVGIRDVPEPRMVFTLRRGDLAHHPGQVSFPGGAAEATDASAVATALRESAEEVALDPVRVEPLGYLDCLETVSGFCVTPVVARLDPEATLVPQPDEVAEVFEVPVAFLLDPGNLRQFDYCAHGPHRKVYEYVTVKPRIWGATALMLVNMIWRMRKTRRAVGGS